MAGQHRIQKLPEQLTGVDRRMGNFPSRWLAMPPALGLRFGIVFEDPIEPGGVGKVKLWKFNAGAETIAPTDRVVRVVDAALVLSATASVGDPMLVARVQGHWIAVRAPSTGTRFEGKLEGNLSRSGVANFHRVIWNGSSWVDDPDVSSSETLQVWDIGRIPIGNILEIEDQIGVIFLHGRYWLEAYDCEDLVEI